MFLLETDKLLYPSDEGWTLKDHFLSRFRAEYAYVLFCAILYLAPERWFLLPRGDIKCSFHPIWRVAPA